VIKLIFLLQSGKTAFLKMEMFLGENTENSSISGTIQHTNTKLAPVCC